MISSLALWYLLRGVENFSSVQLLSRFRLFETPRITARQASLSITNSRSSPKLMPIKSVMPSSHHILCRPLLLLPPILPSIRVFSSESALRMKWPNYWSFSFNISPSNEHPGLISFRMDWLDLLAVQETLKSLLQYHSSKASILRRSVFFIVKLSHPYTTTGKTIALTRRILVGKITSLLFKYAVSVGHSFSSKEQVSFNFKAAVTICSDFRVQEKMSLLFLLFPHLFAMMWWDQMPWLLAIKRNAFESVLMKWMNLESIIQSEVNQKEKNK